MPAAHLCEPAFRMVGRRKGIFKHDRIAWASQPANARSEEVRIEGNKGRSKSYLGKSFKSFIKMEINIMCYALGPCRKRKMPTS